MGERERQSDGRVPGTAPKIRAGAAPPRRRGMSAAEAALSFVSGAATPEAVVALQGGVGNAVVSRSIEADRHEHGPGCGHGGPVAQRRIDPQAGVERRVSAADAVSTPGRPLESRFREKAERAYNMSFAHARVHDDAVAQRAAMDFGARAMTVGSHIIVGPQGMDDETAFHEIDHLYQQAMGSVPGTDNGAGEKVSSPDDPFERQAAANGRRMAQGGAPDLRLPGSPASSQPVQRTPTAPGGPALQQHVPPSAAVQRALQVGTYNYTTRYESRADGKSVEEQRQVLERMVQGINSRFESPQVAGRFSRQERAKFQRERNRITWELEKVIVAPVGERGYHPVLRGTIGAHPDFGSKRHDIKVPDYEHLARHLMGWVYSKQNRHDEKVAAQGIVNDGHVDELLNVLLARLGRWVEGQATARHLSPRDYRAMMDELRTGVASVAAQSLNMGLDTTNRAGEPIGAYSSYFVADPKFQRGMPLHYLRSALIDNGGFGAIMNRPERFSFRDKIIALHDLAEYFGHSRHTPKTIGKYWVNEIEDADSQSTLRTARDGTRVTVHDRGQGLHPSTRDEDSQTTIRARKRNVPVWAGQSYTAARMFKLAQTSGASEKEIGAVAWGIFSFWRLYYDHTTDFAYHTLHEVMDIAQNFGVPYSMENQYATLNETSRQSIYEGLIAARDMADTAHRKILGELADAEGYMRANPLFIPTFQHQTFMRTARELRDQAYAILMNLNTQVERFASWSQRPPTERTDLLRQTIDGLSGVRRDIKEISSRIDNTRFW